MINLPKVLSFQSKQACSAKTDKEKNKIDATLKNDMPLKTVSQKAENLKAYHLSFLGNKNLNDINSLDQQMQNFLKWSDKLISNNSKTETNKLFIPNPTLISPVSSDIQTRNDKTIDLYKQKFTTFLWSGEECSNPTVKDSKTDKIERWDELEKLDFYKRDEKGNLVVVDEHIKLLNDLNIQNIRFGVQNHKLETEKEWNTFGQILKKFHDSGIKISLDMQHFGLPDDFRNDKTPEKSDFLNPDWPDYQAKTAEKVVKKFGKYFDAVTLINEPMITNIFSAGPWNEKCPGWGHPDFDHFAIDRAILIGKAAVKSKALIEKFIQTQPQPDKARKVYVHNEACDNKLDSDVSNKYFRFVTSDMMLGQKWLMDINLKKTNLYNPEDLKDQSGMVKWIVGSYVRNEFKDNDKKVITDPEKVQKLKTEDYNNLVEKLEELKNDHLKLQKETNKNMTDDTVFGIDFYIHNEDAFDPAKKPTLDPLAYSKECESGKRKGLYGVTKDYWNRYKLPVLHTETNIKEEQGPRWAQQQLVELAQLSKSNMPILGFNWYSLMDQYGWDKGLDVSPEEANQNNIGLVDPIKDKNGNYVLREVAEDVLSDLAQELKNN